ncbi:MAG: outer membrane beta-barrel protein [Rikenellaceae bacterium]|nr:outer membrane beta-barrel protein [Rikenellaceae bacterium]
MANKLFRFLLFLLFIISGNNTFSQTTSALQGTVVERSTREPAVGISVYIAKLKKGAVTDANGYFKISNIPQGVYDIDVSGISYTPLSVKELKVIGTLTDFNILIDPATNILDQIVVTSARRMNSEIAVIHATKTADVVMSGISGAQISKSQDKNAAEVVKRIPGVSVMDDRYIMVRGLSGRYNNVWINNSSVPSTEADTRAFSFDMMPSSQVESIMIVKSPSAEIPADFSGGFVKIMTKSMPEVNDMLFSYGLNFNTVTHFRDQMINTSSSTDFLGFDNGERSIRGIVPKRMDNTNTDLVSEITKSGFRNDWSVSTRQPIADQKINVMINRYKLLKKGDKVGIVAALNYSYGSQTYTDMQNARFGVYNTVADKPEYIYKYSDNQYSIDARVGGMLNMTYISGKNKLEFRNIFNQQGTNRYTLREGWQNISALYNQEKREYLYSSRSTYSGQISGNHGFADSDLDWVVGYSYANLNQPDRRMVNREENLIYGDKYYGQMAIDQNEITRDFVNLDEHTFSGSLNFSMPLNTEKSNSSFIKAGILGEYKQRSYSNRQFFYRFNQNNLPEDFVYRDLSEVFAEINYGHDKLYVYEDTDNRNSYKGLNVLGAGYLSYKFSRGGVNILAGLRLEGSMMRLTNYTKIYEFDTKSSNYMQTELFPSLNASYNIDKKKTVRLAYGSSTNRQEFREVSPSVYYDFNLYSDVKGNPDLKHATIHNVDLRYEYYPSNDEYVTISVFYKYFRNPIEWTYLDAGGSYTYTFENAASANNYGLEIDMRKNLSCIGLKNFTLGFNTSVISSHVTFDESSIEADRPMQGQSPYLINASLYYDKKEAGITVGLLYNRIGKRIVGIGRVDTGSGASINNDVPDTYELPRDLIDFVLTKRIGKHTEIKASVKDLLAQKVVFVQYPKFEDSNGIIQKRRQISKSLNPGTDILIGIQLTF